MKYLKSDFNDPSVRQLHVLLFNDLHIGSEAADINHLNTAEYEKRGGYEESIPSQVYLQLSDRKSDKGIDMKWIR